MFSMAYNLTSSVVSWVTCWSGTSASCRSSSSAAMTLGELWFASSGVMASSPCSSLNGVKPVALDFVVLWLQTTFTISSTLLLFGSHTSVLDILYSMMLFALSTWPLESGWRTEAKLFSFVPIRKQESLKCWESNCVPLSTVRDLGTPKRQTMFCQNNF